MFDLGINVKSPVSLPDLQAVKDSGATRVRFGWESKWGFAELTSAIGMAHKLGLNITLGLTPSSRDYFEPGFPNWCQQCADLLREGDILEVINEPNHKPFITSPNAANYAKCFHACREQIRSVMGVNAPPVIIGGMSPEFGNLSPPLFLVDMINKGPKKDGVSAALLAEGLAMHPYCFPSDPRLPDAWNPVLYLDQLSDIFKYCGVENMPLHLTEFGAPSQRDDVKLGGADPTYPTLPYRYSPDFQAEWLARYMQAFRTSRANIVSAIWYTLNDSTNQVFLPWDKYMGLRTASGVAKPVGSVFRAVAAAAGRRPIDKKVRTGPA